MFLNLIISFVILAIEVPLGIFIALNMPKKVVGVPVCLVLTALPLQEKVMQRLERAAVQGDIGPKLAEEHDLAYWNADAVKNGHLAPQLKIATEKEKPVTVNYDELVKSWADAKK